MKSQTNIVVRIPPSPTGYFHVGRARTALFNYLFAKKNNGKIVFRLEDTDKERSKEEYVQDIKDSLSWLGITYDDGPFKQSERTDVYVSYLKKMIEGGSAYISKEEPKEPGDRTEVVRFKNPNKRIAFNDLVRGNIEFDTTELGDFVIAKSLEEPLYHLAVVVDDHEMGVTHIIRGEDGISNTPRQILIQEAIGAPRPIYAHIPLILAPDRSKMSARHGAISLRDFKAKGYLPQAMVNYLALLGWNPGTEQEIFTIKELVEQFDLSKIQKGGAIFDEKKLDWVNKEHIKLLPEEEQFKLLLKSIENEDYLKSAPTLDLSKINWKSVDAKKTKEHLEKVLELLDDKDKIMAYAEEAGRGDVLWPLRYSLSGREKSPDPFTLIKVLGVSEAKKRVSKAIELL